MVQSAGKTTAHWLATRSHVGAAEARPACPSNAAARDTSRPIAECIMMIDEALRRRECYPRVEEIKRGSRVLRLWMEVKWRRSKRVTRAQNMMQRVSGGKFCRLEVER